MKLYKKDSAKPKIIKFKTAYHRIYKQNFARSKFLKS